MRQFLTFSLNDEPFAMPITQVREIIEFPGLTEIPMMPAFLRGVINVRGAVVPVIDLAVRFGRKETITTRRTCIIILEMEQPTGPLQLGMLVDAVNDVLDVDPGAIEPRPTFGAHIRADFIAGMIKRDERFVIALAIEQILSGDELAGLAALQESETA
ncbi:chemotaxis protein CheW [Chitinolyticbacter meiyuanensis]|uniref:chemotaxis protein CheW n=1 Tax=Chitinolyticbacter meiyuanensis TaxID=682798 RepID=UPI001FE9D343|nr:chemotaxis protein CheW [Chitinolyticbacter meiyuanensis]